MHIDNLKCCISHYTVKSRLQYTLEISTFPKRITDCLYPKEIIVSVQKRTNKVSEAWFRSTDLWVMSPTHFHCATSLFHIGAGKKFHFVRNTGKTQVI